MSYTTDTPYYTYKITSDSICPFYLTEKQATIIVSNERDTAMKILKQDLIFREKDDVLQFIHNNFEKIKNSLMELEVKESKGGFENISDFFAAVYEFAKDVLKTIYNFIAELSGKEGENLYTTRWTEVSAPPHSSTGIYDID